MAAGEGSATFTYQGRAGLTHIDLGNGATETFRVVYTVGPAGMQGGGRLRFTFHCGLKYKPEMFFQGLGPGPVTVNRVGSLAEGAGYTLVFARNDTNCGGANQDPCHNITFTIQSGYAVAPGDTIEFTYTGKAPLMSTRWADPEGGHRLRANQKSSSAEPQWAEVSPQSLPTYSVSGGPLAKFFVHIPSDIKWLGTESEPFEVGVVCLDQMGHVCGGPFTGTVNLQWSYALSGLPASYQFSPEDDGIKVFGGVRLLELPPSGRLWGMGAAYGSIHALCVPAKVHQDETSLRRRWGNIHCHSKEGDDHCGRYVTFNQVHRAMARVWRLDFGAVTDHDYGPDPLNAGMQTPSVWQAEADWLPGLREGRYHAFRGYEWSQEEPQRNHHNVLQFVEPGSLCADKDHYAAPEAAAGALAALGHPLLIYPHLHDPSPTSWQSSPETAHRRLIEWFSNKNFVGSDRTPIPTLFEVSDAAPGYTCTYCLRWGWQNRLLLGAYASSDEHNGLSGVRTWESTHPEQVFEAGGVTCVLAAGPTRADIWNALVERRCYATTGSRLWLDFSLKDSGGQHSYPMGSAVPLWELAAGPLEIKVEVIGDADLNYVKLFKWDGASWSEVALPGGGQGINDFTFSATVTGEVRPAAYSVYYVRVRQDDGHCACSSPIFLLDR